MLARDVEFGGTVLHWAAATGDEEIVRLLLLKGADTRVRDCAALNPDPDPRSSPTVVLTTSDFEPSSTDFPSSESLLLLNGADTRVCSRRYDMAPRGLAQRESLQRATVLRCTNNANRPRAPRLAGAEARVHACSPTTACLGMVPLDGDRSHVV